MNYEEFLDKSLRKREPGGNDNGCSRWVGSIDAVVAIDAIVTLIEVWIGMKVWSLAV